MKGLLRFTKSFNGAWLVILFSAFFVNGTLVAQTSTRVRYYESSQAEELATDLKAALEGDVFVLTSSGGLYAYNGQADIATKITIMADEDLAERPILRTIRENNTKQPLRFAGDGASITVKGIEFNSGSLDPGAWPAKYAIRTNADIGRYSLVVEDCYFTGTWQANDGSNGAAVKLYNGTFADSIIFRNCIFEGDEGIVLNNTGTPFDWDNFEITNCTFMNIPDDQAILIRQRGDNRYLPLKIDHCSFYGVGGIDEEIIVTDSLYNVTLTNSIFGTTPADTSWHLWGTGTDITMVDYTNFYECVQPLADQGGTLGTSIWTDDPQFTDPVNGDLTLGNQTLYTMGSDGLPLGDLRWADIFGPKVQPVMTARSDSTMLIRFDEWIDTASAVVAANYEMSGSAGYTGIVKKAELNNFHSVLLTVESFIAQAGKEIIVTVSNVTDLKGNAVDPAHDTSSYMVEELNPVVTAEAQNVTNGDGQVVIVRSNQGAGTLYIILAGEPQSTVSEMDAAVQAGKGAKAAITKAYTDTEIDVYGIRTGTYYAYAADVDGTLSEKGVNAIVITDGIPPVVSNAVQSAGNGPNGMILVQSSEPGKIYIVLDGEPQETENDFISATYVKKGVSKVVTIAGTDTEVSTKGLVPGIYFAYAVDQSGNVSVKGASPLNITDATGIENGIRGMLKVYSSHGMVVVESAGTDAGYIMISDLLGRKIGQGKITSERSEFRMNNSGIYFVTILSDKEVISTTKLLVQQ